MAQNDNFYWYGVAATAYIVSCWLFVVIRWFHTCRAPKERHSYIWPDRKLQVIIYSMSVFLLPYVLDPTSPSAWILWKYYFPCTYYYYSGVLLFCFFGSVKQWNRWKTASWIAAMMIIIAMLPLVVDAWIPDGMMSQSALRSWKWVVLAASIAMVGYSGLAMWQVRKWTKEACDENYSNPEDFPERYARRVGMMPLWLTPIIWPAFIFDSPDVMAWLCIPLTAFNVILLLTALPPWRRLDIMAEEDACGSQDDEEEEWRDEQAEERSRKIAREIEAYVKDGKGFLNPHLKIEHVVEHCSYSRTYVSHVFKTRFGGFSLYVNRLRLKYYEQYLEQNPNVTKDTAAQESGFSSYTAYYKAKERLAREGKQ